MLSLCNDWEFTHSPGSDFFREGPAAGGPYEHVRLPHTAVQTPLHYASEKLYTDTFGYRKAIHINDTSKRYFIQFDGAAHVMTLFVNGREAGSHYCGYTAFKAEITDLLKEGENVVAVKLDSSERGDVPPFGFVMDYLGYGGLYREAWLDEKGPSFIDDVFVFGDHEGRFTAKLNASGEYSKAAVSVFDGDILLCDIPFEGDTASITLPGIKTWSPESPKLYKAAAYLYDKDGSVLDTKQISFGFRSAVFKADGLYLNGKRYFMRGLDRHQCWPYIGYAAPASLQYEDARILKEELACNAVRTSHYPQSQSFIDACDKLGLLVFTEIPGWQHIGGEIWKQRALDNVRDMVLQYRNHPSIVLWGVRINESADDDELYKKTNEIAHELDPTRATSGVRFIQKSSLLEDVYAYNDFSHTGENAGCRKKKDVTPDMGKALLISEHNGHMFPTKSFDTSSRRQEHALRHANVLGAAYSTGEHAGCFGWCMFDYPTHEQFGSGDRVCYHGVMDQFRNPKLAAAVYASQGENEPVLEIGSSMDIGDYPASVIGKVFIFTNADEVELYKNDEYVTVLRPEKSGLPHPPISMSDRVGELIKNHQGYTGRKARLLRESLNAAAEYGMDGLPLKYKLKMARLMLFHRMSYSEGVKLYGEYIGNWGGKTPSWRFIAKKDGKQIAQAERAPSCLLHLDVRVSKRELNEEATFDMAAVRVRILDENDAPAPYAQLPVHFELSGRAELIGPDTVASEGGMCGTFIRTTGKKGAARLSVSTPQTETINIDFSID